MKARQHLLLLLIAVSIWGTSPASAQDSKGTSFRITAEMMGARYPPMKLNKQATSETYGYSETDPILIGGGFDEGSKNIYSFLNALRSPNGQKIHYDRVGSCCSFDTPNSPFDGKGLLELYEIMYDGLEAPKRLYFNWYDKKEPLIPVGLTASSQSPSTDRDPSPNPRG